MEELVPDESTGDEVSMVGFWVFVLFSEQLLIIVAFEARISETEVESEPKSSDVTWTLSPPLCQEVVTLLCLVVASLFCDPLTCVDELNNVREKPCLTADLLSAVASVENKQTSTKFQKQKFHVATIYAEISDLMCPRISLRFAALQGLPVRQTYASPALAPNSFPVQFCPKDPDNQAEFISFGLYIFEVAAHIFRNAAGGQCCRRLC